MARVIASANRIEPTPPAEQHLAAAVDQLEATWPMRGRILACALRDRLVADARALDPVAIELLLGDVPPDLSSSTREAARNVEVRKLFNWLKALHPGVAK